MTSRDFLKHFEWQQKRIEGQLSELVPTSEEPLLRSLRYSLMAASKKFRGILCLEVSRALSGEDEIALPAALSLELVHTYSLIHDDLPSMDNADQRRGQASHHCVFGEARAILAGDALQAKAFELLSWNPDYSALWLKELSTAVGPMGMVLGQDWDTHAEFCPQSQEDWEQLYAKKTGALIGASVAMGAIAAGVESQKLASFRDFGYALGLAFQLQDDLLDADPRSFCSQVGREKVIEVRDAWKLKALKFLKEREFRYEHHLEELTHFVTQREG